MKALERPFCIDIFCKGKLLIVLLRMSVYIAIIARGNVKYKYVYNVPIVLPSQCVGGGGY